MYRNDHMTRLSPGTSDLVDFTAASHRAVKKGDESQRAKCFFGINVDAKSFM